MARALRFGLWSLAAGGVLLAAAMVLYTSTNRSGHTGWEPFTSLVVFLPSAVAGAAALLSWRKLEPIVRPAALALAVGLGGVALVVWLDQTNRLVEYERWIKRGMPTPGSRAD